MADETKRVGDATAGEGSPPGGAERPPAGAAEGGPHTDTAAGNSNAEGNGNRRRRLANLVPGPGPVVRAAEAVDGAVDAAVHTAAGAAARLTSAPEPVARAASAVEDAVGAVGNAVGAATRRWDERPGARVRRVRRMAREPLPYLYDVYPEARRATPRDLGVRTVDVDDIVGTAVGPAAQRGRDFLPLKPFRSQNWAARWQRMRAANERLVVLPPIDAVLYDGGYWVLDGHNRVAAALYAGQIGIDANVTELVPPGAVSHERRGSLASTALDGRAVRTAGAGQAASPDLEDEQALPIRDVPP